MNKEKETPIEEVKGNEVKVSKPDSKAVPAPVNVEEAIPSSIVEETGINLIPTMSKEEIKTEDKKKKINMGALVSLSLLFIISILVVGFNIISKVQLNAEKEKLYAYEKQVSGYDQFIINNNEILKRTDLYKDIQEGRFSTKAVVAYVESIAKKSGTSELTEFSFTGSRSFSFSGKGQDLEDVAKLWYLLTNDSRIEGIVLKSLSRSDMGTTFSFNGDLKLDQFVNSVSK